MEFAKKVVSLGTAFLMAYAPIVVAGEGVPGSQNIKDQTAHLVNQIQQAHGLVAQVPLDQNGEPIEGEVEYRLVFGSDDAQTLQPAKLTGDQVAQHFTQGVDVSDVPRFDEETVQPEVFPFLGLGLLGLGFGLAASRPFFYGPGYGYYNYGYPYYYPYGGYGYYYYPSYPCCY